MSIPGILAEILSEDSTVDLVEPGIYSVYALGEIPGSYDSSGASEIYDRVACNPLYNRLMWGYSVKEYATLCENILASSKDWVLDLACGSLAFTAEIYAKYPESPVVFLDQSLKLLRKGKVRLEKLTGHLPGHMFFLHADALRLPFRDDVFETVISLNLLHCVNDVKTVVEEIIRVLIENGNLAMTTLVRGSRWSNLYLYMLARSGALVSRRPEELLSVFNELGIQANHEIKGNLAFLKHGGKLG